jgi:cytochrome c biogenesis protein CcmG, thiol:disulfide interchange protein DsbE
MKFKNGVIAALLGFASSTAFAVAAGDSLPVLSVKHVKEGALSNDAFKGKVTIVNFWATWCAACKVELIEMEDAFKPLVGEADFQTAFVSLDKEPEKAVEWFQANLKEPARFLKDLYIDATFETADKLQVDSFPMTLIIGRDGKVAYVQKGFKEGEGSTEVLAKLAGDILRKH